MPGAEKSPAQALLRERALKRLNHLADTMLITGRIPDGQETLAILEDNTESAEDVKTRANSIARNTHVGEPASSGGLKFGVQESAPVVLDRLLTKAVETAASDIHLEPHNRSCRVRFRIDGILQGVALIPEELAPALLSRVKVLCDMDIAEKRRPQDGNFRFPFQNRTVDVRVSSVPAGGGEKIVLRLLDQEALSLELEELGTSPRELETIVSAITQPQGMILVTGPTGSGKTTTLYAALKRIRNPGTNIVTIEDPIEYHLDGINQSQVKPEIGYTFANALRAFLRQDPDVIMVGEIRDAETAQIALRAAMTGHLVLSTVHTNDAATTITRLLDLEAEPYLVASSLSLIVAQRLVRRLCPDCRVPDSRAEPGTFVAAGCPRCFGTGYRGRVGVFEVMTVEDGIRNLVHESAPAERIRQAASAGGMRLLIDDAMVKWRAGLTALKEIEIEIGHPNDKE